MARSVLLLLLVVVTCVLLIQDVAVAKKKSGKMAKKMMKRRIPTIVMELENNVTALWKEVDQLGQPVHVHLHGDGHVMDPDRLHHHHHHHHEDDENHSHDQDLKSQDNDDDDENKNEHDAPKEDKHSHKHHKKSHGDEDNDDGDDGKDYKKKDDDSKDKGMMMKKKKMMMMKKMKHKHDHHHHGHHHSGDDREEEEEEEEEGWKEKWMHGGRKGTHVHIHLHTGKEEDEMESSQHHVETPLPHEYRYARCNVVGNSALPSMERQDIKGTFYFRQMPEQPLEVKGSLEGFVVKPHDHNDASLQHLHLRGLHGHEFGDTSNGCNSLGGHHNPSGVAHGGPEAEHRHIGDFGNLEVKDDGTAITSFTDDVASLFGSGSMLGRSLVIHAGPDDLGHGHSNSSKASGNAGGRIACCVIVACSEPAGILFIKGN